MKRKPTLSRDILLRLGQQLRAHYDDTVSADVLPPRMADLMAKLREVAP